MTPSHTDKMSSAEDEITDAAHPDAPAPGDEGLDAPGPADEGEGQDELEDSGPVTLSRVRDIPKGTITGPQGTTRIDGSPMGWAEAHGSGKAGWTIAEYEAAQRRVSGRSGERSSFDILTGQLEESDAFRQLEQVFPKWKDLVSSLTHRTRVALVDGKPVDPNDEDTFGSLWTNAQGVMRRHGMAAVKVAGLTSEARATLVEGQAKADAEAGIDWTKLPAHPDLAGALKRARATLPIDLDEPSVWFSVIDQRRALGRRLELPDDEHQDLSRWAIAHPESFDPDSPRSWRIASARWSDRVGSALGPVGYVGRPIGVFLAPASKDGGWHLYPCLSADLIRLVLELGGSIGRTLTDASIPSDSVAEFLTRMNHEALHVGPLELVDSLTQLHEQLKAAGLAVGRPSLTDPRDRWGRLEAKHYWAGDGQKQPLHVQVLTRGGVGSALGSRFTRKRLGSIKEPGALVASAAMEIGEAIECASDRGLPVLLSGEAAGLLDGQVRVGRMKGRPGQVGFTRSDGLSASTERLVAEQAVSRLRTLRSAGEERVTLDAGARQVLRMQLVKPLEEDRVLLPPQRAVAAQMTVGSGVNASATGTGKTICTARALFHRASRATRFRGLVAAEGRLLGQWAEEFAVGAPGRGMPALVPNAEILILDDALPIAAQLRAFDRELGERAGIVLCARSTLDRFPSELTELRYHIGVIDEALHYANPATEAHQALRKVRFEAMADCWLLTATPRGKSSESLDVLVGLAVRDESMITERLNVREAGDLMDEQNAHRLRLNYGPHLVRIPKAAMAAYLPDELPAKGLRLEPDAHLAALLEAIRSGGRKAYQDLLKALAKLRELDSENPLRKAALAEMARAQGQVLANVGVFVDASIDPETLCRSQATLAQALVREGVVGEAMRGSGDGLPLLRAVVAQTIESVVADDQVIVFGERIRCLHQLAGTLNERHKIDARVVDGSVGGHEFEATKRAFQDGEFPVLCLSRVGQEGHNFQNASALVHLDLPWTPGPLDQRIGRSVRPGARRDYVQTYIPYILGGGVEHIVSILAERAAEHHQILDSFEGVAANKSTIATQLADITGQVADSRMEEGFLQSAAKLRVAAAVFGG